MRNLSAPSRQRMIEDMTIRTFGDETQHEYIRHVEAREFLGRSPDTATGEELRAFQLQTETGCAAAEHETRPTALRFFFKVTLGRAELAKCPVRTSAQAAARLSRRKRCCACWRPPRPGPKHKAALSVAYGAGLRAMRGGRAEGRRH